MPLECLPRLSATEGQQCLTKKNGFSLCDRGWRRRCSRAAPMAPALGATPQLGGIRSPAHHGGRTAAAAPPPDIILVPDLGKFKLA